MSGHIKAFFMLHSEVIKNYAQVAAWATAGLYFLSKLIMGYFVTDLSLSITSQRQPMSTLGKDYLVVSITITKGDRGTFQVSDSHIITTQGSVVRQHKLNIRRLKSESKNHGRQFVFPPEPLQNWRLNFSPGESANYSTWTVIESDEPCLIEVGIIGTAFASRIFSQWRATTVSLPLAKQNLATKVKVSSIL